MESLSVYKCSKGTKSQKDHGTARLNKRQLKGKLASSGGINRASVPRNRLYCQSSNQQEQLSKRNDV